jgi:hypothetical protein
MKMRSVFAGAALLLFVVGSPARADVTVILDQNGAYKCMSYRYGSMSGFPRIWSGTAIFPGPRTLNPNGDSLGDLAPTIVENPAHQRWPTAVWARRAGSDYDLVYSSWDGVQWAPTRYVHPDTAYDELEPRLVYNSAGRLYMVWWANLPGSSAVFFSANFAGRWTSAVLISDDGVDSRHPSLTLQDESTVVVSFETSRGVETKWVQILDPATITDDINPKLQIVIH